MSTARTKKRAAEAAGFTVKLALGLVFISPLIIGLFFSFQTEQELMSYPLHLLPQHFTLENYQAVFAKVPLLLYLKNSVIVCVIAILAQVIFATLAAYAFACFEFPFKKLLFSLVLATTMVPGEVVVVTNYLTIQNMGLTNSYAGLVRVLTHLPREPSRWMEKNTVSSIHSCPSSLESTSFTKKMTWFPAWTLWKISLSATKKPMDWES